MQKNSTELKTTNILEHVSAQLVYRGPDVPEVIGISWTKLKDHAVSQRFNIVQNNMNEYLQHLFGQLESHGISPFPSFMYVKPKDASWRLITQESGDGLTKTSKAWIVA